MYSKSVNKIINEKDPLPNSGVGNRRQEEPVPNYLYREGDVPLEGQNNTFIVLGRDREKESITGYGGIGDTQAGAIDIVVGMGAPVPLNGAFLDPDFEKDAARIYISQKTDLDKYFKLKYRTVEYSAMAVGSEEIEARSGIAIKADSVRIIARESLRFVAGTDEKNSKGGDIPVNVGIDIVGNNDPDTLQAMVKGENLLICLEELNNNVTNIAKVLEMFLQNQQNFNALTMAHYHISPFYGIPTPPSPILIQDGASSIIKILKDCQTKLLQIRPQLEFLSQENLRQTGATYILSSLNRVN